MTRPRRTKLKPPGKCMFCSGGNLTKEHFWPRWAASLLPSYPENRHVEQVYTYVEKSRLVRPPAIRQRTGNAWTKKIRVVCQSCNSGWMSRLEDKARIMLTPLIKGEAVELSLEAVLVLSQWIVLEMMVGEQNQPIEVVTTAEQRRHFWQELEMPKNLNIWIANFALIRWWEAANCDAATDVSLMRAGGGAASEILIVAAVAARARLKRNWCFMLCLPAIGNCCAFNKRSVAISSNRRY
jgi:hypothetical protein